MEFPSIWQTRSSTPAMSGRHSAHIRRPPTRVRSVNVGAEPGAAARFPRADGRRRASKAVMMTITEPTITSARPLSLPMRRGDYWSGRVVACRRFQSAAISCRRKCNALARQWSLVPLCHATNQYTSVGEEIDGQRSNSRKQDS